MRRRWVAAPVALSLALALSACPSEGPGTTVDPTGTSTEPVRGGTLVVSIRDMETLDPVKASGRGALAAVAQIFDALTAVDPATNDVVPAAARRWRVSKNQLRWRFVLADRRYHDGRRVRARDFERAFDRVTRRSTGSDYAHQLDQVRGFQRSKFGIRTPSGRIRFSRRLAGVDAKRDDLLVIRLERPFAELPYQLAHPSLAPLHPTYRKKITGLGTKPIGNGPFRVVRFREDESVLVERFDRHATPPLLDRLDFQVSARTEEGWSRFLQARVDVAEVPPSAVHSGDTVYGNEGFTPFWAALYFGINLERNKYDKPVVRRAISLAIDREAIAATVYGGTRDPATGLIPTGVRGYLPDRCPFCVHDEARARNIIDAAFPRRKLRITIDYLSETSSKQVARAIANDLDDVGIRVTTRVHSLNQYRKLLNRDGHDMAQLGWLADVPTPDVFLSQQLRSGSANNHSEYGDNRFDRLLDKARKTRNEERRLKLYRRAEARALDEMPLIPIVFFRNRVAIAERVHGLVLDGAGIFDASRVWLDPA